MAIKAESSNCPELVSSIVLAQTPIISKKKKRRNNIGGSSFLRKIEMLLRSHISINIVTRNIK